MAVFPIPVMAIEMEGLQSLAVVAAQLDQAPAAAKATVLVVIQAPVEVQVLAEAQALS